MEIKTRVFVLKALMLLTLNVDARDHEHKRIQSVEWAVFPLKDGRLRVNIYNGLGKRLLILIKSFNGETIQQNYIGKKQVKAAINYDVSDLNEGDYKIYVYGHNIGESKNFHIKNITEKHYRMLTLK